MHSDYLWQICDYLWQITFGVCILITLSLISFMDKNTLRSVYPIACPIFIDIMNVVGLFPGFTNEQIEMHSV